MTTTIQLCFKSGKLYSTYEYATSLGADWTVLHIAAPLVGTEMYQQLLDREEIDTSYNWDNSFFQERAYDTSEISAVELKKLVYDANISINFFNNANLLKGSFQKAINNFSDVTSSYPWHIIAHYSLGICYQGLGDSKKYNSSLKHAAHLINTDERSKALYKNYKSKMPELESFLYKANSFATTAV